MIPEYKHRLQHHIWGGVHCAKSGDGSAYYILRLMFTLLTCQFLASELPCNIMLDHSPNVALHPVMNSRGFNCLQNTE
jgi:hypothetical protein